MGAQYLYCYHKPYPALVQPPHINLRNRKFIPKLQGGAGWDGRSADGIEPAGAKPH